MQSNKVESFPKQSFLQHYLRCIQGDGRLGDHRSVYWGLKHMQNWKQQYVQLLGIMLHNFQTPQLQSVTPTKGLRA